MHDPRAALIGRIVRTSRIRNGLTQEKLAERCRLSRRTVIAVEKGKNYTVTILLTILDQLPDVRRSLARLLLR